MHLLVLGLALAAACAAQSSAGAGPNQATSPAPSPPPGPQPATPASQAPASASAAENAESRSEGTTAATAEGGEDAALESQIQNALGKDPTLVHDSVRVAVSREAVELTGSVATSRERLTATRIAQSYSGSKRVVSRITVSANPQEPGTPEKKNAAGSQRQLRR